MENQIEKFREHPVYNDRNLWCKQMFCHYFSANLKKQSTSPFLN